MWRLTVFGVSVSRLWFSRTAVVSFFSTSVTSHAPAECGFGSGTRKRPVVVLAVSVCRLFVEGEWQTFAVPCSFANTTVLVVSNGTSATGRGVKVVWCFVLFVTGWWSWTLLRLFLCVFRAFCFLVLLCYVSLFDCVGSKNDFVVAATDIDTTEERMRIVIENEFCNVFVSFMTMLSGQ